MRHQLLETIRAVALEELEAASELAATLDRHARWVEDWSAVARASAADRVAGRPQRDRQPAPSTPAPPRTGATSRAIGLLADAITPIVFSGHLEEADRLADALRAAAPDDPITTARLDEIDMIRAEWRGDFIASHTIAEELRSADVDDRSWAIGTAIVAHHFAALDPPRARRLVDESVARLGEEPRAIFLRAEAAIGEARFADAVDEQFRGWGVDRVDELPRAPGPGGRCHRAVGPGRVAAAARSPRRDGVGAGDDRGGGDAPDRVPLRPDAAVGGGRLSAVTRPRRFEDLAEAAASERRTSSPFLATDVCVAAAHVAFHADEPEVALFALGAVENVGQRTVGAFGWRRWLDEQLRPLVDEEHAAVLHAEGAAMSPRDAVSEALRRLRSA